jgi:hypothetical protein
MLGENVFFTLLPFTDITKNTQRVSVFHLKWISTIREIDFSEVLLGMQYNYRYAIYPTSVAVPSFMNHDRPL